MRIRVNKNLEIDEVVSKLKSLRRKRILSDSERKSLVEHERALKEYEESGEMFYSKDFVTELTLEKFRKIFTPKRLEILNQLDKRNFSSIAALSRCLNRDIKNIYDDLKILENFELVKLRKNGKSTIPLLNVESVNIDFFSR
ncbi:hypothetical protein KY337_05660 [Candidatus Woesearchaeota archaeon]|nr:hypothetical protein [Candidatus Woesearchaeota archaeon]